MGLLKKAAELCILCDIQMILKFRDLNGKIVQYSSTDIRDSLEEQTNFFFTEKSYPDFFNTQKAKEALEDLKTSLKGLENKKSEEFLEKKVKLEPENFLPFGDNYEVAF